MGQLMKTELNRWGRKWPWPNFSSLLAADVFEIMENLTTDGLWSRLEEQTF